MTSVIVCGGETAGCILAARLTENPDISVLLLEAGPDFASLEETPLEIRDSWSHEAFNSGRYDWGYLTEDVLGDGVERNHAFHGKVMGGSSAVNAAAMCLPPAADFDQWVALGNDRWSWDAVRPVYRAVEDDPIGGDHGRGGPVPVRRVPHEQMRPFFADFMRSAAAQAYRVLEDVNGGVSGVGPYTANSVDGVRQSMNLCYLTPARERPNLEIRSSVMVDRVAWSGNRATGVHLASGELLESDLVVLAAGALSSPALLIRSGIGPADTLARVGIEQRHALEGVGRNLREHPIVAPTYTLREPSDAIGRPMEVMLTMASSAASETRPDLLAMPLTPPVGPSGPPVVVTLVELLQPRSIGRLELRSADPGEDPRIFYNLLDHADDRTRLLEGVRKLRDIAAVEPYASHLGDELWPGEALQSDAELLEAMVATRIPAAHPMGTCAMGPADAPSSVVDQQGRVHGLEGLYVIDASIFPTVTSAGPHFTVVMLAERCAAWLRDGLGADGALASQVPTRETA